MNPIADLEIGLYLWDPQEGVYRVDLRFSPPDSEAEVRREDNIRITLKLDQLRALTHDSESYGIYLGQSVFGNPKIQEMFSNARISADTKRIPLHLRLVIGHDVQELHGVRWETIRHPSDGTLVLTGEQVLFSRYLSSQDWQHVGLRLKGELHALVVIANPGDITSYTRGGHPLAAIDVQGELARAKAGLGTIRVTALASAGTATLTRLVQELRSATYDILYLVCHGAVVEQTPQIWLEDDQGSSVRIPGAELAARLSELASRPQLVVLASCQSAGAGEASSDDEGALAALGPRLAAAGIPAVLAMQGNVQMKTVEHFMPTFFRELEQHGQIDRAVAIARGEVRDHPDYWAPVLYMRLRSGRIWYVPGQSKGDGPFQQWDALIMNMRSRHCTPILGSGLTERYFGSMRDIAHHWAEKHAFPMAPHDQDELPRVAQYLMVQQRRNFLHTKLAQTLSEELFRRFDQRLAPADRGIALQALLKQVGTRIRQEDPEEPHRILANFPFSIYITTNIDNMLADALIEIGKHPQVMLYPWNEKMKDLTREQLQYQPDEFHPLVFHLFGHMSEPVSLALTEDDYFDYLLSLTRRNRKEVYPHRVRRALADSGQLFLGFHPEDWIFRVLLRSIRQEGGSLLEAYAHVAVQIDPESGRILVPERARRFLEAYFQDADISVYWGSAESFLKKLNENWAAEPDKNPPPLL
jgi:hypothetical protein